MTLTPARALIGALTPEEAKQIAAPDSWPWPMSEEAKRWVEQFAETYGDSIRAENERKAQRGLDDIAKRNGEIKAERDQHFDAKAHEDFMRSLG